MTTEEKAELKKKWGAVSYDYKTQRNEIFTEQGQQCFIQIRDKAKELLKAAGCFRSQEAMSGVSGNSWLHLACIDLMVERGEIVEVTPSDVWGQHRIFTTPFSG